MSTRLERAEALLERIGFAGRDRTVHGWIHDYFVCEKDDTTQGDGAMSEKDRNDKQRARLSAKAAAGMPRRIFAVEDAIGQRVLVRRGEIGHYAVPEGVDWTLLRNAQSFEETQAAIAGSMFGWHTPAAAAAMVAPKASTTERVVKGDQKTIAQVVDDISQASQGTGVDVSPKDVGFIISLFFEALAQDPAMPEMNEHLQRIADAAAAVRDE